MPNKKRTSKSYPTPFRLHHTCLQTLLTFLYIEITQRTAHIAQFPGTRALSNAYVFDQRGTTKSIFTNETIYAKEKVIAQCRNK